jgi:CheY-like chemotaxis protein
MRRRILLADDSVTIQKVIELTFMDEDFEVRAVSNGDDALRALTEINPDFVIADVHMPGANGYEVCRRAKQSRPDLPVLLLVGTFEPFDEAQARACGADSFLKKPFDSQDLLQRVQELVAGTNISGGAPAAAPATAAAEPDWGGFQLEPEPASPAFGAIDAAHAVDAVAEPAATPTPSWEPQSYLPEGEPMFEIEDVPAEPAPAWQASPAPAAEADVFSLTPEPLKTIEDTPEPPRRTVGFDPWAAPPPGSELSDLERVGVPEEAGPLVGSLQETEQRIEDAAATPHFEQAEPTHEPWASGTEIEPEAIPEPLPTVTPITAASPYFESTPEPPAPVAPEPVAPEPPAQAPAVMAPVPAMPAIPAAGTNGGGPLSDEDVERIARRVVELMGDKVVRAVAWDVVPDLAELVIRDRLRELEGQVESLE